MKLVQLIGLLGVADALRLPSGLSGLSRRAALAGLLTAPAACTAYDYGSDSPSTGLPERKKKARKRPDGFGGFVEVSEEEYVDRTKPPIAKVLDKVLDSDEPAPPRAAPAAAPAASRGAKSSAKPLTLEEMVQNSITQKAELLGRELTPTEAKDLEAKLRALMAA